MDLRFDARRREVAGRVVRWDAVLAAAGQRWRFLRGSLSWPQDVSRVKLLRDHDPSQPVGVALAFDVRDDGLHGRFRIGRGAVGDQVLFDVADRVVDAFSIGPRTDRSGFQVDRHGVNVVHASELVETSLVGIGADVTAVASATFGMSRPPGLLPVAESRIVEGPLPSGRGFQVGLRPTRGFYDV